MICTRGGCTAPILPPPGRKVTHTVSADRLFCSHRCAGIENARKRGPAYFQTIGVKGRARMREMDTRVLKPHEQQLMVEGRYLEAARVIGKRNYSAGWMARHIGSRQRPARKAS